jgi:hypothetical protein
MVVFFLMINFVTEENATIIRKSVENISTYFSDDH